MAQTETFFLELAHAIGMEKIQINHQGHFTLLDDDIPVEFQICDNQATLCIYFEAGRLTDNPSRMKLELLLMANYFGIGTRGFNLALEAQSRALILSRTLSVASITVDDVINILDVIPTLYQGIEALASSSLKDIDGEDVKQYDRNFSARQMIRI
ncbi:type III secretion system chaperone [Thalassomonas viridans]|uniref:Type III secretion system chaperone n=1 Tax=Thalassomonas viridans TaxID=137584 RepID=A0AAF0CCU2_9GAMM|nr:type III secretion system chaperone [Thalassomonas viridans]WDE08683.1 type III secretion system chaperone [Thalassomonas viridans]